jgi:hypothetical protein
MRRNLREVIMNGSFNARMTEGKALARERANRGESGRCKWPVPKQAPAGERFETKLEAGIAEIVAGLVYRREQERASLAYYEMENAGVADEIPF